MKTIRALGVAAISVGCMGATTPACFELADDCVYLRTCSLAGGEDGGADGGTPPGCDPTKSASPVADTCGVFVSSSKGSDTSGTGTKEAPYQTLAHALGVAKGQPVYACGETFTVTASVALSARVDLYGALDCTQSWAYDAAKKTQLQADPTMTPIPLRLASGASGSSLHDFAITAVDATSPGGSSIAVLDDHADLTLENVDVAAGAGKDGTAGAAQSQVMTPAIANGGDGTGDATCMNMNVIVGGAGGTNACNGTATNGGNGGKGLPAKTGDDGLSGQPTMTSSNGGTGQTGAACQSGGVGMAGSTGASGTGAHGIGHISTSGYVAESAALGGPGTSGQGGGGGGAAHACDMNDMFAGPSGGGGGAGGCGGAPGNPGASGGSSIGIVALGAHLTLTNVTITARGGGVGGPGGNGQLGGTGGQQGNQGGAGACPGGIGGQGGTGGAGAGGAGGHSVGIATQGGTLGGLSSTTITLGASGMGGAGGDGDMGEARGDNGKACKTLDFANPASPTACVM